MNRSVFRPPRCLPAGREPSAERPAPCAGGRGGTHRTAAQGAARLGAEGACLTGLLACAGGIAGPFWLVFLPLVLLTATAVSPEAGIVVGALASAGVYVASLLSHTVNTATVGRLVVVLPIL